eukprot:TRINITY_DN9307_c0_g1_i1.p1 TRINITY_DN9307_c0_g1~~TRINITY_DN9307_c0_g1_i1.p1  ORF type:complete len:657 (+),score=126.59 TRINITY_DN9307_c0_g1_i1:64-2034(+)
MPVEIPSELQVDEYQMNTKRNVEIQNDYSLKVILKNQTKFQINTKYGLINRRMCFQENNFENYYFEDFCIDHLTRLIDMDQNDITDLPPHFIIKLLLGCSDLVDKEPISEKLGFLIIKLVSSLMCNNDSGIMGWGFTDITMLSNNFNNFLPLLLLSENNTIIIDFLISILALGQQRQINFHLTSLIRESKYLVHTQFTLKLNQLPSMCLLLHYFFTTINVSLSSGNPTFYECAKPLMNPLIQTESQYTLLNISFLPKLYNLINLVSINFHRYCANNTIQMFLLLIQELPSVTSLLSEFLVGPYRLYIQKELLDLNFHLDLLYLVLDDQCSETINSRVTNSFSQCLSLLFNRKFMDYSISNYDMLLSKPFPLKSNDNQKYGKTLIELIFDVLSKNNESRLVTCLEVLLKGLSYEEWIAIKKQIPVSKKIPSLLYEMIKKRGINLDTLDIICDTLSYAIVGDFSLLSQILLNEIEFLDFCCLLPSETNVLFRRIILENFKFNVIPPKKILPFIDKFLRMSMMNLRSSSFSENNLCILNALVVLIWIKCAYSLNFNPKEHVWFKLGSKHIFKAIDTFFEDLTKDIFDEFISLKEQQKKLEKLAEIFGFFLDFHSFSADDNYQVEKSSAIAYSELRLVAYAIYEKSINRVEEIENCYCCR